MTQKRRDNHSTEFGLWLREQHEIDSALGYVATNIDYIWKNYKTGEWMIIEEKRYGAQVKNYQKDIFITLHRAIKDPKYRGFHVITFQRTSPNDGLIFIDGKEVTRDQLINFLKFRF